MREHLRILVEACRDLFRAQNRPLCVQSSFFVVVGAFFALVSTQGVPFVPAFVRTA